MSGIAYPIEYWMNTHGAVMRTAGLAHDDFLRDVARWGMVGRFGNFPGDNRSLDSLVPELPDAVEHPPWQWNFATVNVGHAWDFAGAVLDFLVSDAFERSDGAIDFPALSAAGSSFRVGIYSGKPGKFYRDENVHLWLPRGLVTSDNRQLDWLAGHGNGNLYLALVNQSFREERATLPLDRALVECRDGDARCWRNNGAAPPLRVSGNQVAVVVPANGNNFGLHADGRFYPYSTPQGRRIAWRQAVCDGTLFAKGCTREEAGQRLRVELGRTLGEFETALAARDASVNFATLDGRQQETLLDFASSEGIAGLRAEFVSAVLAGDWSRVVSEHLYVRYAGHAPDHPRNKAFAQSWEIP